jgi:hypothetical protein
MEKGTNTENAWPQWISPIGILPVDTVAPTKRQIYARALVLSQGDCGTASTNIKLMYNNNSVSRKVE